MDYTIDIRRSRRAKRTSLRITPRGEVVLTMPWWGSKRRAVAWAESRREWIERSLQRMAERGASNPPHTREEVEALRTLARQKLPNFLAEASAKCGIGYNKVTIRASRTRWGSCSSEGNISLSLYLAALPDELIEYVCIHELCHRIHPNHSAEFHALVDHHLGGRERELRRRLKSYMPH